jgi:hypothetical protein
MVDHVWVITQFMSIAGGRVEVMTEATAVTSKQCIHPVQETEPTSLTQ